MYLLLRATSLPRQDSRMSAMCFLLAISMRGFLFKWNPLNMTKCRRVPTPLRSTSPCSLTVTGSTRVKRARLALRRGRRADPCWESAPASSGARPPRGPWQSIQRRYKRDADMMQAIQYDPIQSNTIQSAPTQYTTIQHNTSTNAGR